ncbi:BOP1NT (NUC169) domain family protein [Babesia bovis T2Bo]|uniref:Ribosome biogenesis protein BOP1 homolog n=1 Tax=Babesia bovis TaxID=5865 RepID=A7AMI3_BABBO|nr:BOP1NT (NUC169) domain family protein [Babesia bovis T2Bo]EDO07767.1 BOP1NT (NUC169) domain family protein [Babesia bovis T2Bo]|eukprot:XP_001611335.1 BOP1NT (NUC169) domain containing protein [Babesia bovis T2Bo]
MAPSRRKSKAKRDVAKSGSDSTSSTRSHSRSDSISSRGRDETVVDESITDLNVESDTYFDSDEDEGQVNRIGRVPLEWYEREEHIGYTIDGEKLIKELDSTELGKLIFKSENPDAWRTIVDVRNNRTVRLSDDDLKLISRIRKGMYPQENYDQEDLYVEFDNEDAIHPVAYVPRPKANFMPSKFEAAKIRRLVKLIKSGKLVVKDEPDELPEEPPEDIWGDCIYQYDPKTARRGRHEEITAPKAPLPTHSESYNPPEEYLFDDKEKEEWLETDPEERKIDYLPQQHECLRRVGSYQNLILERFRRCLQLYLCPRAVKLKMNVDPESLYPKLPDIDSLRPFPTRLSVEYRVKGVRKLSVDSTGHWIVLASESSLSLCNLLDGRVFDSIEGMNSIFDICWHPHLPILIVSHGNTLSFIAVELPNMRSSLDVRGTKRTGSSEEGKTAYEKALSLVQSETDTGAWRSAKFGRHQGLSVDHVDELRHLSVHQHGNYVVGVSPLCHDSVNQCVIYCLTKRNFVRVGTKMANNSIRLAMFHPLEPKLILCLRRGVRFYNLKVSNEKLENEGEKLSGVDFPVSMHVDSRAQLMAVADEKGTVSLFDLNVGSFPYKKFQFQEGRIVHVEFHRSLPLLMIASANGVIHLIHVKVPTDLSQEPVIVPLRDLRMSGVTHAHWHKKEPWIYTSGLDCGYMWA